ncbi:TetR/AcrR family transcriptional regulator [Nakamurella deserti]|uniref:TetR/AcrR family transcriptional regulator n=1 Tax=Nakamurella deserti TaxID=2164074 RepID=UPI000DBE7D3F|nr:TetR/AcrR family transcriptional regulator [Nakamurella deserti]
MAPATRERIIDALRTVLARGGASAVTLEAVAAEAGLSKGGLLYHFKNKESLYAALLAESEADVVAQMASRMERMSAARAFLDFALPASELEAASTSALIAAVRADDSVGPDAAAALVAGFHRWDEPLLAEVADPVLAQTIRLVGLGLYLGSVAGIPVPDPQLLAEVTERLVRQAEATAPAAVPRGSGG